MWRVDFAHKKPGWLTSHRVVRTKSPIILSGSGVVCTHSRYVLVIEPALYYAKNPFILGIKPRVLGVACTKNSRVLGIKPMVYYSIYCSYWEWNQTYATVK